MVPANDGVSIMFARLACVLIAASIALAANASADKDYVAIEQRLTSEQLRATGLASLSPEQLALLNRLLRDESAAASVGDVTAPATQRIAADSEKPASAPYIATESKTFQARLKGTISAWQPGTVFELENGQRWQVLKGSVTLPKPLTTPEILVVPGIAGRWFLQVTEDLPKARVERIE
jgi:hypothetical protein